MLLKKKNFIFHPFIFAIYPILFFYDLNKHELQFSETLLPALIALAGTLLLFFLFKLILRDFTKTGIVASIILISFFFYESIISKLSGFAIGKYLLNIDQGLLYSYGIILFILILGVKLKKGNLKELTVLFNAVSLILMVFPVSSIAVYEIKKNIFSQEESSEFQTISVSASTSPDVKPDIYYIILDAYAREDVLKNFYDYDNSEFINFLKSKGFYVAPRSRTNYPVTIPSVASTLNMNYIDMLVPEKKRFEKDLLPLDNLVENNKVVSFLKSKGYSYIHFDSGMEPTNKNKHADIAESYSKVLTPFGEYLINKTFVKALNIKLLDPIHRKRNIILHAFEKLEEVPSMKEPTFAFAHILMPHGPFVFDKDGNLPENLETRNIKGYLDYLAFANKKVKYLVNKILSKSDNPPIIIIQADHGQEQLGQCMQPSQILLKEKMSILNAYYLPEKVKKHLYESITPVNSFRVLFDHYFGTNLGIIEDKTYFTYCYEHIYQPVLVPDESYLPHSLGEKVSNEEWIKSLLKAVETYPNYSAARNTLGAEYYKAGYYQKAEKQFKQTIKNNWESLHLSYYNLGRTFFSMNRFSDAIEQLKRAIEIAPNMIDSYYIIADLYSKLDRYQEAEKSLKRAIEIAPNMIESYHIIADLYSKLDRYQEVEESLNKALTINPNDKLAHFRLAEMYATLNNQKALWHFNEIAQSFPSFKSSTNLGIAYLRFGQYQKAIEAFKEAILINPDFDEVYSNLGAAYVKLNRHEDALLQYRKAISLNPNNLKARQNIATIHIASGNFRDAVEPLKQSQRIDPDSFSTYGTLGFVYANLKRYNEAIEQFKKALEINSNDAKTHIFIATAYDNINEGGNAIKHIIIAKKLHEDNNKSGEVVKADKLLQKLLKKYNVNLETFLKVNNNDNS